MWVHQYQPLLNGLLQKALVELCTQSLPWEGRLEIDGIFCVSGKDPTQQIVIKIHKALEKPDGGRNPSKQPRNPPGGNKKVLIEAGKIVSSSTTGTKGNKKSPAGKSTSAMPLNLSLPNLKSGASITHHPNTSQIASTSVSTSLSLPKSLTVGNQSLRALLGNKPGELSQLPFPNVADVLSEYQSQSKGTILKQPVWHKKDSDSTVPLLDSIKQELDTGSEAGSESFSKIKDEPGDAESESSLDLDEDTLPAISVTCKPCSLTFENFPALQAHTMEMHKRYPCRQCSSTFSLRCNLRRHERLHAGIKPHSCKYCKKTFSRQADLKTHVMKHAEGTAIDWISCSKCPKSFRNAVNLRLHMYQVHKEKDCVYACNICGKVFHDPDVFQIHRDSHTASLVQAGKAHAKGNESGFSTPVLNGSQADSMDEDAMSADEAELDVREILKQRLLAGSMSLGSSPKIGRGEDGEGDDIGLYFGSPLVIREENDSNDGDKRSNRRKSKPSKLVAEEEEIEDDTENLEPQCDGASQHSGVDVENVIRSGKRDALQDDHGGDMIIQEIKRPRIQSEVIPNLYESFGMADQSLEDIMKQVNENFYKNKDVLIAEEKEKENENKGKRPIKPKPAKKPISVPITSTPKAPILLFVNANAQTPHISGGKVAIPPTPPSLKMSIKKDDQSWSVNPNARKKKSEVTASSIPHDLATYRDNDLKDYTCSQWGCSFSCIGFQFFEDHMLSIHGRYPCKFCSQTFTGRNNRTRHIRYHITGKQHQCADCSKFFARPDSLKEHRFIHTKSYRDSNCCNCNVFFEKKATLLSHMKKCFTDQQLETDKLPPEEIEREMMMKKDYKNQSQDSSIDIQHTPVKPIKDGPSIPSDVGVMKAEYLQKEKQKIMDVKTYLDNQLASITSDTTGGFVTMTTKSRNIPKTINIIPRTLPQGTIEIIPQNLMFTPAEPIQIRPQLSGNPKGTIEIQPQPGYESEETTEIQPQSVDDQSEITTEDGIMDIRPEPSEADMPNQPSSHDKDTTVMNLDATGNRIQAELAALTAEASDSSGDEDDNVGLQIDDQRDSEMDSQASELPDAAQEDELLIEENEGVESEPAVAEYEKDMEQEDQPEDRTES